MPHWREEAAAGRKRPPTSPRHAYSPDLGPAAGSGLEEEFAATEEVRQRRRPPSARIAPPHWTSTLPPCSARRGKEDGQGSEGRRKVSLRCHTRPCLHQGAPAGGEGSPATAAGSCSISHEACTGKKNVDFGM
jgi:hypothetical protein